MKKLNKVFLTLALALFITSVFAIEKDSCLPKDVCCEEITPGPFAFSYPKDVGLACPRDFYLHGEFLWMKPSEEGLEFAMDQDYIKPDPSSPDFPLRNGKVKGFSSDSQEWDWRPGFRVGFGFYAMHDAWNIQADWTYLKIKADSEVTNGGSGILLPLWLPLHNAPDHYQLEIDHASSRWSGDYNTADIMIGKPYHVSRYYISNPMFGVRAGWIDQDYHLRYFVNYVENNVWLKNDFWGVGLRGAYEGQFLLGSGWYLFGKAAFALLFGKFDTSQQSEYPGFLYKTEDSFYSVQPNAEIGFGISWSKFYHKNQYLVSVKVGYEFHQWWDQNQARKFFATDPTGNDTVSRGDLSFNGFMFGLHLEF